MKSPSRRRARLVEQPKIRDWILRFGFVVAETNGSTSVAVDPGSVDVRLSGGGGGFANIEYKVLPFLGLEFGIDHHRCGHERFGRAGLKHIGTDVDVLGMSALTLGANFHFVKDADRSTSMPGPCWHSTGYSKWSASLGLGR